MLMPIVFVFAFLTFLFIAIVSFFVWHAFSKERSFLYWSASGGIQAAGWGLLFFSASQHLPFLNGAAESTIFAGHVLGYLALAHFSYGQIKRAQHVVWGLVVLAFCLLDTASRAQGFINRWDGVIAMLHGTLNLLMILAIFRARRAENRGVAYTAIAAYALLVLATYNKGLQTFLHATSDTALTAQTDINAAVVLGATLGVIVGTIALSLLAFTRTAKSMQDFASYDSLTQVFNRRAWEMALEQETRRSRRKSSPYCVIMLDLDHFKSINDRYGHAAGDKTLKSTARLIDSTLREIDIVCRYGGEEFLILLTDTRLAEGAIIAERIRQMVEATPVEFGDIQFHLTCSAGVAEFDPIHEPVQTIVERADEAMYQAKNQGRNRVAVAAKPA
jgi:diguanylate cyclase (GGDEF)-like protein